MSDILDGGVESFINKCRKELLIHIPSDLVNDVVAKLNRVYEDQKLAAEAQGETLSDLGEMKRILTHFVMGELKEEGNEYRQEIERYLVSVRIGELTAEVKGRENKEIGVDKPIEFRKPK